MMIPSQGMSRFRISDSTSSTSVPDMIAGDYFAGARSHSATCRASRRRSPAAITLADLPVRAKLACGSTGVNGRVLAQDGLHGHPPDVAAILAGYRPIQI
jgi:hypothetical protein